MNASSDGPTDGSVSASRGDAGAGASVTVGSTVRSIGTSTDGPSGTTDEGSSTVNAGTMASGGGVGVIEQRSSQTGGRFAGAY